MDNKLQFSDRLRQARKNANLSQADLSRKAGIAPATLSTYEKGTMPPLDKAVQIAEALNVSVDWLCGKDVEAKSSITNFSLKDYLNSIVITLFEIDTQTEYDTENQEFRIKISDKKVAYYCKRISELLQVYRSGLLSDDMFIMCVDKLISEFESYSFKFGNVLTTGEIDSINDFILNFPIPEELSAGVFTTTIKDRYDSQKDKRPVNVLISLDEYEKNIIPIIKNDDKAQPNDFLDD